MIIKERKCKVCDKEITKFYNVSLGKFRSSKSTFAKDGVRYNRYWFCNKCWKQLIRYVRVEDGKK